MRLFLDTEFTDFQQPRLISVGLVCEDGHACYCALADGWHPSLCSPFVRETVLPLLNLEDALTRAEARTGMLRWLAALGAPKLRIIADAAIDLMLVSQWLAPGLHAASRPPCPLPPGCLVWEQLQWPGSAMARRAGKSACASLAGSRST